MFNYTAAIILAAGGSSRFGSPKQLAQWNGKSLIEHTVDVALTSLADPVIGVLGAEVEQCCRLLAKRPLKIVINHNWATGQSSSIKTGLSALPKDVDSALFMLVDLPGVTSSMVDAIIQRYRQTLAPLVWPEFAGQRGNPILFDRTLFPALNQINGDTGGKSILQEYQHQAERVAVSDAGILQDIDYKTDLN
jgi:molybdenum cofactor cytidylyltransferase